MIRTTLCVILLFGAQGASADACYTQPEWWSSKTRHDALKPKPLTRGKIQALEATLRNFGELQGKVVGTENDFICKGTEKSPRKRISRSTIEGEVSTGRGAFSLSAELDSKRKTRTERLSLRLNGNHLVATGRSKVKVLSVSSSHIKYRERVGGVSGNGRRIIMDRLVSLKARGTSLTIKYKVYWQGQLTSESTWKLRKR